MSVTKHSAQNNYFSINSHGGLTTRVLSPLDMKQWRLQISLVRIIVPGDEHSKYEQFVKNMSSVQVSKPNGSLEMLTGDSITKLGIIPRYQISKGSWPRNCRCHCRKCSWISCRGSGGVCEWAASACYWGCTSLGENCASLPRNAYDWRWSPKISWK